jgi:3-hydroxyacyl-CoA dehydrogenase/enoyl-CoA hydratase/3-hydroxybutyryl-CoA epimerase
MQAAMNAVDEGLSPETIDAAMKKFGMPMGPIELVDVVGLDIAVAAGRQMSASATPPKCLTQLVNDQHLGKKSGRGFYVWEDGKIKNRLSPGAIPEGLAQRLVQPLITRTQELVRDGVVADNDLADAGVIFGTGFAPFKGGPLHSQSSPINTI